MIVALALLHAPDALPELRRLIAHASVVRDPLFKERARHNHGEYGARMSLQHLSRRNTTPSRQVG